MTGPEIVSLKQAGDSVTLHVQACGPMSIGKYPEVEIVGVDGARRIAVRVPQKSADRQFSRIGLTNETAIGKHLTISRDPNQVDPSKPFWGIAQFNGRVATPAPKQAPESGGPIPGLDDVADDLPPTEEAFRQDRQPDGVAQLDRLFQLYNVCFDHAASIARKHGTLAPDVAAMTATLFIAATGRGIRV